MLINCVIMGIIDYGEGKYKFDLLPVVDLGEIFPHYVHYDKMEYKVGDVLELDFNEITFSLKREIESLQARLIQKDGLR